MDNQIEKLKQLANKNNPKAQYMLGLALYKGKSVTKDRRTGLIWLKKAKQNKYPQAYLTLGILYLQSADKNGKYAEAHNCLLESLKLKVYKSIPYLKKLYYSNNIKKKQKKEILRQIKKAAKSI